MAGDMSEQKDTPRTKNLSVVGLSALTGFIAVVIILAALLIGLSIDNMLGQRGPATICVVGLSMPLSLYVMVKTAFFLIKRAQFTQNKQDQTDEKEE